MRRIDGKRSIAAGYGACFEHLSAAYRRFFGRPAWEVDAIGHGVAPFHRWIAYGWSARGPHRTMKSQPLPNESVLDLRGLRCPQPVLRAKKAMRNVPVGGILVLQCTDPLTVIDIPHFVSQTGHVLSAQERDNDVYIFKIVKRHRP
jgi:tRNA 2-thiouridine synthesizing protein A